MISLLEVPCVREHAMRLSVEHYRLLGEASRAELLKGVLIEKSRKSPLHRLITRRLVKALESQITPEFEVWKEDPLTFSDSEPEPDVAVVPRASDSYTSAHPTTAALIIEVAVSTREIDRVKALIYAEAKVPEYWIVCPNERQLEVYRKPEGQTYAEVSVVNAPAFLASTAQPGVGIDLEALFG